MNSKSDPIIIIGAGPAGLAAAIELAKAKKEVIVFDQWEEGQINELGQTKLCGGGLVRRALDTLGKAPAKILEHKLVRVVIDGKKTDLPCSIAPVTTIDRALLAKELTREAQSLGAVFHFSTKVGSIDFQTKKILTSKGIFSYSALIGADGFFSIVRKKLAEEKLVETRREYFETIEYSVPPVDRPLTFDFNNKYFGTGYGWVFPLPGKCVIGGGDIHHSDRKHKNRIKEGVLAWAKDNKLPINPKSLRGWGIPIDFSAYSFPNNVYLVGDAAGLAGPISGEGISPAIISGMEVAKLIIDPSYHPESLTELIQKRGKELLLLKIISSAGIVKSVIFAVIAFGLKHRALLNRLTGNLFKRKYAPGSKISRKSTLLH